MTIDKFFRRADGQTHIYFVTAISNVSAPTAAEINAGVALADAVYDMNGWTIANKTIDAPSLANAFVGSIDGEDQVDSCSLTLYDDKTSATMRTAMAKGTQGFIVISPYAKVTASDADVWTVRISGANREYGMDTKPASFMVSFAVLDRPVQDAPWPSGVTI